MAVPGELSENCRQVLRDIDADLEKLSVALRSRIATLRTTGRGYGSHVSCTPRIEVHRRDVPRGSCGA
jgi:hypothetical protein